MKYEEYLPLRGNRVNPNQLVVGTEYFTEDDREPPYTSVKKGVFSKIQNNMAMFRERGIGEFQFVVNPFNSIAPSGVGIMSNKFYTVKPAPTIDNNIMREINSTLNVFNPLIPGDVKASVFFEENEDYEPFIIRTPQGLFSGNAIDWPVASSSGKYFVECKDNTPSGWEGNSYGRYIKPDGRTFIKMGIGGTLSLVEKPYWYDTGSVPGTKYFHLVKSDNVTKFMTSVLAEQTLPEDFTALGTDHCNQTGPSGTYKLVEISQDELSDYAKKGGKRQRKTNRRYKRRNTKKHSKRRTL